MTRSPFPGGRVAVGLLAFLMAAAGVFGHNLQDFENRVKSFTLENGIQFLVLERDDAPVISFHTYAAVGSVNEVTGITGMSHLFEHLAFKGSTTVGTSDYEAEQAAMEAVNSLYMKLRQERLKGEQADPDRLTSLEQEFRKAQERAEQYRVHDEFEQALIRAGGVGLNATTSSDATRYFVSLPSNKLELWMSLESDRFLNPVLREFYKERDVVMEERRLRTESNPRGQLMEEFLAVAYKAHPYGSPVIGHMSDLEAMNRPQAEEFFRKHYTPNNLTIAVVGDVRFREVRRLAEVYFGRIPARPKPEPVLTTEPPQLGEKRVVVEAPSQPVVYIGYHKPAISHPDNAVFDVMSDILSSGRTSRLYRSLIRDEQIAVGAYAFHGYPGDRYPNLFIFSVSPAPGHTNEECEAAIESQLDQLKNGRVTQEELERAKTRSRAELIRALASNRGLASYLTFYEAITGDWRNLFQQLDDIEKVTAEDIRRVAREYFKETNKTVGTIQTQRSEG